MKFFKNRVVAIVIAIIAVVLSGVLSARSGLLGAIREVEMLYYDGVEAEEGNYLRPSIDSQMRLKHNTVGSMLGILAGYDELASVTEDLRDAKDYVYYNLGDYDEYTIESMSWANQELEAVLARLRVEMDRVSFPEREAAMLEQCFEDLTGAQRMIEQAGYNEAVREFNSTEMTKFPADILLESLGNYHGGASYFD